MAIWDLNGQTMCEPTAFRVYDRKICRTDTTASGKRVTDVIAFKMRVELTYDTLTAEEMEIVSDAYHATGSFLFSFPYLGTTKTIEVMVADEFDHEMLYADPELWKGLTIALEEV